MVDPTKAQALHDALADFMSQGSASGFSWYNAAKDFQPLAAAVIGILIAAFTYRSTMAKVFLDREIEQNRRADERRGLYLRTLFLLKELAPQAEKLATKLQAAVETQQYEDGWQIETLVISGARGTIQQAWTSLNLMPEEAATELSKLHTSLEFMVFFKDELASKKTPPSRNLCAEMHKIASASGALIPIFEKAIKKLRGSR